MTKEKPKPAPKPEEPNLGVVITEMPRLVCWPGLARTK